MRPGPIPISVTLAVCFGLLLLIAVASVLAIQWSAARRNTIDLIGYISELVVEEIEKEVRGHLLPARNQAVFISQEIARGDYELEQEERVLDLLKGALGTTPRVRAISILDKESRYLSVRRLESGRIETVASEWRDDRLIEQALVEIEAAEGPYWGELVVTASGEPIINLRQPLRRDGRLLGFVVVAITIPALSEIVAAAGEAFGATAFILYGEDQILAHPFLAGGQVAVSEAQPTVPVAGFGDVVLASLWEGTDLGLLESSGESPVKALRLDVGGTEYLALYKWTHDYGAVPWAIGVWAPFASINTELRRLAMAGLAGLAVLVVAILAAVVLGRQIGRPIREAAESAALVGELDLEHVDRLPPSLIRELNEQSRAFNTMLASLRSFETYVPRSLVRRMISGGEDQAVASDERELTLLFTDVVGFTPLAESLPASEVAAFLNQHFALLGACVEAEGGTIDKYIGDALMAFWGAPEPQSDTAHRACRAALAMARAVAEDNERRATRGAAPVRVRIGIHTGSVVVGNIGAPGRINYTVVGDTVNTGQRLEGLGKDLDRGEPVTILISEATAALLNGDFAVEPAGSFAVKGKSTDLSVYRLLAETQQPPADADAALARDALVEQP